MGEHPQPAGESAADGASAGARDPGPAEALLALFTLFLGAAWLDLMLAGGLAEVTAAGVLSVVLLTMLGKLGQTLWTHRTHFTRQFLVAGVLAAPGAYHLAWVLPSLDIAPEAVQARMRVGPTARGFLHWQDRIWGQGQGHVMDTAAGVSLHRVRQGPAEALARIPPEGAPAQAAVVRSPTKGKRYFPRRNTLLPELRLLPWRRAFLYVGTATGDPPADGSAALLTLRSDGTLGFWSPGWLLLPTLTVLLIPFFGRAGRALLGPGSTHLAWALLALWTLGYWGPA